MLAPRTDTKDHEAPQTDTSKDKLPPERRPGQTLMSLDSSVIPPPFNLEIHRGVKSRDPDLQLSPQAPKGSEASEKRIRRPRAIFSHLRAFLLKEIAPTRNDFTAQHDEVV